MSEGFVFECISDCIHFKPMKVPKWGWACWSEHRKMFKQFEKTPTVFCSNDFVWVRCGRGRGRPFYETPGTLGVSETCLCVSHIHAYTLARTNVSTYVHTDVYVFTYVRARVRKRTYVHARTYVHVRKRTYVRTYVIMYMST